MGLTVLAGIAFAVEVDQENPTHRGRKPCKFLPPPFLVDSNFCFFCRIAEIISRFERKGYKLVAIKLVIPTNDFAQKHYHDLKERPFFSGLCDFLSSGPVLAMVWEGEGVIKYGRKLIGATDPQKSEPGTIRGDLAVVVGRRNKLTGNERFQLPPVRVESGSCTAKEGKGIPTGARRGSRRNLRCKLEGDRPAEGLQEATSLAETGGVGLRSCVGSRLIPENK
ncbi:hypothetical protein KSP40_PGU018038 [Platanthera guangdongensis]|uniref:nucleoside-diphosphate kinase n=1 Tax=Platanthera guangdongensis TaxID=2320717 RepID=A0ABR2M4J5_9ASPA